MITIVILGILAAVAVPSYSEYTKRVKIAEAYVLIESMQKAQKAMYLEVGRFASAHFGPEAFNDNQIGRKNTLTAVMLEEGMIDPGQEALHQYLNNEGKFLRQAIPDGESSYFSLNINFAFYDDGNLYAQGTEVSDEEYSLTQFPMPGNVMGLSSGISGSHVCGVELAPTDIMNLEESSGQLSLVGASTIFDGAECTFVFNFLAARAGGEFTMTPMMEVSDPLLEYEK